MATKRLQFRMPNPVSPDRLARREKMATMIRNSDVVRLSVNLPRNIHMKFKRECVSDRQQMKQILMDMILKYIESKGQSL